MFQPIDTLEIIKMALETDKLMRQINDAEYSTEILYNDETGEYGIGIVGWVYGFPTLYLNNADEDEAVESEDEITEAFTYTFVLKFNGKTFDVVDFVQQEGV